MTVRRHGAPEAGRWMIDVQVERADGQVERLRKVRRCNHREALAYERELRRELESGQHAEREAVSVPTFAAFVADYIDFSRSSAGRRGANKPGTIFQKNNNITHHILPAFASMRLDRVTTRDVDRFAGNLEAKGLSRNTVANILITLRHMLRVGARWGYVKTLPEISARKSRSDKIERDEYLDEAELEAFLDAADGEWRPVFTLLARTGLRTGEARALKWRDVDFRAERIYVRASMTKHGLDTPKANKPRYVPMTWDLVQLLRALPKEHELVFGGEEGLAETAIERACKRTAKDAGLVCEDGSPKLFGGHALRHTWATLGLAQGLKPRSLMAWGGWSSLAMLERYGHHDDANDRDIDRLAPRRPLAVVDGNMAAPAK